KVPAPEELSLGVALGPCPVAPGPPGPAARSAPNPGSRGDLRDRADPDAGTVDPVASADLGERPLPGLGGGGPIARLGERLPVPSPRVEGAGDRPVGHSGFLGGA